MTRKQRSEWSFFGLVQVSPISRIASLVLVGLVGGRDRLGASEEGPTSPCGPPTPDPSPNL